MTVNKRLEELVKIYSDGVVSQFAKRIGVSHTSIASMMPGSRESKPGFEIIAKIVETFPEVSTDWLIKDEPPMIKETYHVSNKAKGNQNIQAGQNIGNVNTASQSDCEQQLASTLKEIEYLKQIIQEKEKYIRLLEKN